MNYSNPIAMVSNLLIFYAIYAGAFALFSPKIARWKILVFSLPFLAVSYEFCMLVSSYALLRVIVGNLLCCLPVYLFFKGRLRVRIFYSIAAVTAIIATEMICVLILPQQGESEYLRVYSVFLAIYLSLLIIVIFLFYSANKKAVNLSDMDAMTVYFQGISQLVIVFGYVVNAHAVNADLLNTAVSVLVAFFLFTAADMALYHSMRRSIVAARLKAENAALASQLASQQKYYSMLESQFTNIRQIRHDISNHMYTIKALLAEGNSEEASRYTEAYLKDVSQAKFSRVCENSSANAFLVYKREKMEEKGIRTDFSVQLKEDCSVSSVDLITVLGNLLDNAEESCCSLPGSIVRLRVERKDNSLMIFTENPFLENRNHAERIHGLDRGNGFSILSNLAEKYQGSFSHTAQDGLFCCAVVMSLQPATEER